MDDGKVLGRRRRNGYPRDPFGGRRKRRKKREREMPDRVAEFQAVRSVPGIDGVERFQLRDAGILCHSDQIQAGIGKRPRTISEANQRKQRPRRPDFRISGAGGFERGKREDDVADGSRPDKQPAANA